MALSYNKLWKLLIDKGIKKMELRDRLQISNSTLAKMGKNEPISLSVIEKMCVVLGCDIGDIIEYVPEQKDGEMQRRN